MNIINGETVNKKFHWFHPKSILDKITPRYKNKLLPGWVAKYSTKHFLNKREEDEYIFNLSTQPEDWHYRTKKVIYNINSDGYRTGELSTLTPEIIKNSIILFGCSLTFGSSVAEDETIGHHLKMLTGKNVINLGVPSSSIYFNTVNSFLFYKLFGIPYSIVYIWTTLDRDLIFNKTSVAHVGPWNCSEVSTKYTVDPIQTNYFDSFNYDEINANARGMFNSMMAKSFWEDKCKLVMGSFFEQTAHFTNSNLVFSNDKKARDLLHSGSGSNYNAAEKIAKFMGEI
jgi:hypothetical protein